MVLPILLSIVAGLAVLLTLLLFVPIDLRVMIQKEERTSVKLRVRWWLATFRQSLLPRAPRAARPPREKKPRPPKRERGPVRWPRYILAVIRTEGLIARGLKLTPRLVGEFRIRELSLDLRVGLDDPASTGEFFGGLSTVMVPIQTLSGWRVRVEPLFDGLALDGTLETEVRIVPGRILGTMLAFLFSAPALRAGGAVLRERFR